MNGTDLKQEYADGFRDGYLALTLLPNPSNRYTQAFLRAAKIRTSA